jgi:hypothetical protein
MGKNNLMCKCAATVVALLLLFAMCPAIAGAAAGDGALSIINLQVAPQPVMGGSNITIMFQLYNAYSSSLQNVNLQLTAANPIITVSPSSTYLTDAIGTGIFGGYTNQLSYKIHVPSTLATGEYTIDVIANYETAQPGATGGLSTLPSESVMPIGLYVYGAPNVTVGITNTQIVSNKQMRVSTRISNIGYTKATNLSVRFLNAKGVAVSGLSSLNIVELDAGSSLNASVNYNVTGNSTISEGAYPVPVLVSYASQYNITYSKQLNLTSSIVINNPNLIVQLANPQPQSLYQGRNQSATLQIENIGTGIAKNVTVTLRSGSGITLLSSLSSFFFSELDPNQMVSEPVLIGANGTNNTSLTAELQYYPASYQNLISKTQVLNLSLSPAAQFSVVSQISSLAPGATAVPVTFKVKNTGTIDAEQVQLSLQTTYPVTPIASTSYISDLKPGASANATFVVDVDSQAVSGNYPLTVYEQWKQPDGATNQQFSGSNNYFVNISATSSSDTLLIVAVVVVVVIAIVAYRRFKKAKQAPKKKASS